MPDPEVLKPPPLDSGENPQPELQPDEGRLTETADSPPQLQTASTSPDDEGPDTDAVRALSLQTARQVAELYRMLGVGSESGKTKETLEPLEHVSSTPLHIAAADILAEAAYISYIGSAYTSGEILYTDLRKKGYDITKGTAMEIMFALAEMGIIENPEVSKLYNKHRGLRESSPLAAASGDEPPEKLSDVAYNPEGMGPLWSIHIPSRGQRAEELEETSVAMGTIRHRTDLIGEDIREVLKETQPPERFFSHYVGYHIPREKRKAQNEAISRRWAEHVASVYIPKNEASSVPLGQILRSIMANYSEPGHGDVRGIYLRTAFETIKYLAGTQTINDVRHTYDGLKGREFSLSDMPWEAFERWSKAPKPPSKLGRILTLRRKSPTDAQYRAFRQLMEAPVYRLATQTQIHDSIAPHAQDYSAPNPSPSNNTSRVNEEYYSYMRYAVEAERRMLHFRNWRKQNQDGAPDFVPELWP